MALNSTLDDAYNIIQLLPVSDRIIIEAGTPLIKRYGEQAISKIYSWYSAKVNGYSSVWSSASQGVDLNITLGTVAKAFLAPSLLSGDSFFKPKSSQTKVADKPAVTIEPYVVADLKTMDRGETEVDIAWRGGASAAIALGDAPIETLDSFIAQCEEKGLDSMVDMMNVEYPLGVLQKLKKIPTVVILHRGVDEEKFNREKQIPLYEIRRIKSRYNIMISIAGGDTLREVQSSIFNDADVVVVWKSVFQSTEETISLVQGFLDVIK